MTQEPAPDSYLLRWKGDELAVTLRLDARRAGRAVFRTDLGGAWHDVPMSETAPGTFACTVPLDAVGIFSGKACFFPKGKDQPEWPHGGNMRVKVEPAATRRANSIYTVFPRQFGGARFLNPEDEPGVREAQNFLDAKGYSVIPPSGTFRDVARELGHIMDDMGFRIVQLLPIFPVPATFARMGRYGCPFAATDFLSVDPACAEFDPHATPLDQFRELADAVHAKGGALFVDLPANHTGWAATLQTHHPGWYRHAADGAFVSPGAWGVTWEDLVELDYSNPELRDYMADVFLFWCRHGVDGFRCDAGYMIPAEAWTRIVARVRAEYPDTVFMLEGLGGKLEVTDRLLSESGLDWAYSEIFQTYDRAAFEWYLPGAIERAERYGALVHFAETHDNDRLAKKGRTYARMRVQIAALLSHQGAWGIANGVEWFATEKIDVHGASALNWGAKDNMVPLIGRLNAILAGHPAFGPDTHLEVVTRGDGNTLAVVRAHPQAAVLVLANLDCDSPATIRWDAAKFGASLVTDLVTGKQFAVDPSAGVELEPGEVLGLVKGEREVKGESRKVKGEMEVKGESRKVKDDIGKDHLSPFTLHHSPFTWQWPEDARREVCVPAGCALRVVAPHPFRVRVTDGTRTLAVERSGEGNFADLELPPYAGDGTRAEARTLEIAVYTPEGVRHAASRVLLLPPGESARVKLVYSGDEIRADRALETILADGAGAMSRVKLAWGDIRSQYDALFAANTNPRVPSDRLILWTRCRAWLQYEGYSHEINADCIESVRADPAGRFAEWTFRVPCGMGQTARFIFMLSLAPEGGNAARLVVWRLEAADAQERVPPVRIVFRPDMEWRSFHSVTKAQGAVEQAFGAPSAIKVFKDSKDSKVFKVFKVFNDFINPNNPKDLNNLNDPNNPNDLKDLNDLEGLKTLSGFLFQPYGADERLEFAIANGEFHHEPQWTYCVPHPEEAERGQEPCGDLYSPGWISCDFQAPGDAAILSAVYVKEVKGESRKVKGEREVKGESRKVKDDTETNHPSPFTLHLSPFTIPVSSALKEFLKLFIVRRDDVKTVIAGYPWFLDWGRDTFIFLRGAIAAGFEKEAKDIVIAFARFEENGTLPNIIYGDTAGNRDTTDAPLWFIVAVRDLCAKFGRKKFLATECGGGRTLADVVESIAANYVKGTPNGIRVDHDSGLVWSPPHFTWMDTNYPACTPRVGYPVEIQALWIAALRFLGGTWKALAERAEESLATYFANGNGLADCLDAPNGEPAAQAARDDAIRPNQLFVVSLLEGERGKVKGEGCAVEGTSGLGQQIVRACERLLVPGGVRSLAEGHPLYRGVYAGDEDTARKPAYHNGTVWAWPFPLYAEAAVATGTLTREQALSLLASSVENLNAGCVCQLSEIADGDAPHAQKGCRAQAWSTSELLRVWLALGQK